jgi:hypothetical protein
MKRSVAALLVVICVFATSGCRRGVRSTKSYDLNKGKVTAVYLPAGREIQVEFSTEGKTPVNAILVSKEDADAAMEVVEKNGDLDAAMKAIKKQIAMKNNVESAIMSCPKTESKSEWALLFTTNKATSVTVKTTGK